MKLIPYLNFAGNAEDALNFYKDALNGNILIESRYGDSPMPCDEDWKNKIIHARLAFGNNEIMISDVMKDRQVSTKGNIQLSLELDNAQDLETVFNKLATNGNVTMPLAKQFWGALFGMLEDQFGVSWMLNCDLPKNGL